MVRDGDNNHHDDIEQETADDDIRHYDHDENDPYM